MREREREKGGGRGLEWERARKTADLREKWASAERGEDLKCNEREEEAEEGEKERERERVGKEKGSGEKQ